MGDHDKFLDALVDFLVGDEVRMSVQLESGIGKKEAERWKKLRDATPLFGYYPGDEGKANAKRELKEFLCEMFGE